MYVSLFNPLMSNCFLVFLFCFVFIFMPLLKDLFFYIPDKAKETCNCISLWTYNPVPEAVIEKYKIDPLVC